MTEQRPDPIDLNRHTNEAGAPSITDLEETAGPRQVKALEQRLGGQLRDEQIESAFTYHAPKGDQPERYVRLRAGGKALAQFIVAATPASREQSIALTKLEEAIMWANASIARNE